ncbi:precorrin-6y C5,15-methyltransferase (decarboxylating) subunit CbiE [Rhodococcus sp. NPDC058521]|uniref:precorrin-6y C5,15-methyltransferase (decarboxylating) subunit CbiE n=1 Tax=Rhodococcus sp. NPDC058521 TaxID=3346536 RepID=UPI00365C0342
MSPVVVVGIGADGWDGLSPTARREIASAEVLMGSRRQLALVPDSAAKRVVWPSPLVPALSALLREHDGVSVCVLGSGDPMFHGIGSTLVGLLGPDGVRVVPHPSSVTLACARMGWTSHEIPVVSVVHREIETVLPELGDGARLLVLGRDERTPAALAEVLTQHGFGGSVLTVLSDLGADRESDFRGSARDWNRGPAGALNVIAIECVGDQARTRLGRLPGLPDDAYVGDGQMTKQEIRALTLCALAPAPGELLWDVGGGSGTIGIEWMRTHPRCRAVCFERKDSRVEQIRANAHRLGVPSLVSAGEVPDAFNSLSSATSVPDAIFVGGGVTQDRLLDHCWRRLPVGGRMVVNAVTAESEATLLAWYGAHGGTLRKFQVYRGEPLGDFTSWRPHLPVVQWSVTKQAAAAREGQERP